RVGEREAPPVETDDTLQVGDRLSLDGLAIQAGSAEPFDPLPAAIPRQLRRPPDDDTSDPRFLGWPAIAAAATLSHIHDAGRRSPPLLLRHRCRARGVAMFLHSSLGRLSTAPHVLAGFAIAVGLVVAAGLATGDDPGAR